MIIYREAYKNELAGVADMMTESFKEYSYFSMYIEDEKKRFKFIGAIYEMLVRAYHKKAVILVGLQESKIVSAAILRSPKSLEPNLLDYILSGGLKVIFTGGLANTLGFMHMNKEANAECHKEYPHSWFLVAIAVSSSCQGQGLGRKMLDDFIKPYISKHGGGIFTFITHSEGNRAFYIKNGFTEFHAKIVRRNKKEITNWSYKMEIAPETAKIDKV